MKKLRLELDELQVESFQTAEAPAERGTVQGHVSYRCTGNVNGITCNDAYTCGGVGETCDMNTCYVTCGGPCGGEEDDTHTYDHTDCGTCQITLCAC